MMSFASPALAADKPTAEQVEHFEKRIKPILMETCVKCHGEKKSEHGLRLDSRAGMLRGGDNGPAIVPGNPDASLLIKALRYENEKLEMPPKGKLELDTISDFEKWVKDGAVWSEEKE